MHLFKKYGDDASLTTEAARTQVDDTFILDMIRQISVLRSTVNEISGDSVELKKIFDTMGNMLTSRFGLNFKIIIDKNQLLGTHIVSPPEENVLIGSVDQYYDLLNKHFKENKKTADDMLAIKKDEENLYNTIYNNYKTLKNKLTTGNLIVDLKEARILNTPTNLVVFVYACPTKLFSNTYGLTDTEIVAAILHEVGHNFAAIENSYRHVINTTVILDAIHETIRVKHGSPMDAIKLSYKKITNEELKASNIISAAVALKNKYRSISMNADDNFVITTTDNESVADQFASRFLLGDALASALSKLGGLDRPYTSIEMLYTSYKENLVINSILVIVLSHFLVFTLPAFIIVLTLTSIGELRTFNNSARVYDKFNRRLLKIKQDGIRQLRLLKESDNYNKQTMDKLVLIIGNVDKTISMHKDNSTNITKLLEKFEFNKDSTNLITFNDSISNLMENELHYISEKI